METHHKGGKQIRFPVEMACSNDTLEVVECKSCGEAFASYKSRICLTCCTSCAKKRRGKCVTCNKVFMKRTRDTKACGKDCFREYATVANAKKRKGFFKTKKEEYKNKIIDYTESPTGKGYVGINKSPFMPAADGGHGYQGVLMQDDDRELVQCHSCGEWMSLITHRHLKKCCGITTNEYKTKYGFMNSTGLVSDETSLRLTKACLKNKVGQAEFKKNYGSNNDLLSRKNVHNGTVEYQNGHGTCPLQLKTRLIEFVRCNRELPAPSNRGRKIYKALKSRYGEFGHALAAHGLPWMKRQGTNMRYAFPDGTVYKYNINQFHDREQLFAMIMDKCPVMKEEFTTTISLKES